jgi:hypothetical protein
VLINGTVVTPNLAFGKSGGIHALDQGLYDLTFTATGKKAPVLLAFNKAPLLMDIVYTSILLNSADNKLRLLHMASGKFMTRFIHVAPDLAAVDLYVDGQIAFSTISYKISTEYSVFDDRPHQFAVRLAGAAANSEPLVARAHRIPAGVAASIVLMGLSNTKDAKQALQILYTIPPPLLPAGKAFGSVINASPGTSAIDVLIAGKPVFANIPYSSGSEGYFEPGVFNFIVVPNGKKEPVLLNLQGIQITAGTIYNIYAINSLGKLSTLLVTSKSYGDMIAAKK